MNVDRVLHAVKIAALFATVCATASCRKDMYDQPRLKPLAKSEFFPDGAAARVPLQDTVARGGIDENGTFATGMTSGKYIDTLPMTLTRQLLYRGRERYEIYCAPCHGPGGDGDGIVVQRGFPVPPSFHVKRLHDAPLGHFVNVIARGYGTMYAYAQRVRPEDRWAIAAYIRALQLSRDGTLNDAPTEARARLKAMP